MTTHRTIGKPAKMAAAPIAGHWGIYVVLALLAVPAQIAATQCHASTRYVQPGATELSPGYQLRPTTAVGPTARHALIPCHASRALTVHPVCVTSPIPLLLARACLTSTTRRMAQRLTWTAEATPTLGVAWVEPATRILTALLGTATARRALCQLRDKLAQTANKTFSRLTLTVAAPPAPCSVKLVTLAGRASETQTVRLAAASLMCALAARMVSKTATKLI